MKKAAVPWAQAELGRKKKKRKRHHKLSWALSNTLKKVVLHLNNLNDLPLSCDPNKRRYFILQEIAYGLS